MKHLCKLTLSYLNSVVADIPGDMIYKGQLDGINSPGWVLGHIAVETDDGLKHLTGQGVVPESWYDHFFFTAPKITALEGLPEKDEMLKAANEVVEALLDAVLSTADELLDQPCHSEFLKAKLPTERDWFGHILTTHIAIHAGNIATWRKIHGLPAASY